MFDRGSLTANGHLDPEGEEFLGKVVKDEGQAAPGTDYSSQKSAPAGNRTQNLRIQRHVRYH